MNGGRATGVENERAQHIRPFRINENKFNYGKVVIVLSEGRSGSGFLCELISNVAGAPDDILRNELFGETREEQEKLEDPLLVAKNYLSEQRKIHSEGIIGMKWKPDVLNDAYQQVWKWMHEEGFLAVHNVRNPLDRCLSMQKHKSADVPAHCHDKVCAKLGKSVTYEVDPSAVLTYVKTMINWLKEVNDFLDRAKVERLDVSYDKLSCGTDSSRIADYVVGSGAHTVTMEDLRTGFEKTSSSRQGEQVTNFKEVQKAFNGTELKHLLRAKWCRNVL